MEQVTEMAKVAAENQIYKEYMKTFQAKNSAHEQCERELLQVNINLKTDCLLLQSKVNELTQKNKEQTDEINRLNNGIKEYVEKINKLESEKSNVVDINKEAMGC